MMKSEVPKREPREPYPDLCTVKLLPDDNFLRRLPQSLEPEQRHALEAILLAADSIALSLERMLQLCVNVDTEKGLVSIRTRTEMFSAAWSIVDSTNVFNMLIRQTIISEGTKTDSPFKKLNVAYEIRTWRQHFREKLRNAIGQRGTRWPLYGAISFTSSLTSRGDFDPNEILFNRARGYIILAGSLGGAEGNDWLKTIDPIGLAFERSITGPLFLVKDHEIDLMSLYLEIYDFLESASTHLEKSIIDQAKKYSEENGFPLNDLISPLPAFDLVYDLERDNLGLT